VRTRLTGPSDPGMVTKLARAIAAILVISQGACACPPWEDGNAFTLDGVWFSGPAIAAATPDDTLVSWYEADLPDTTPVGFPVVGLDATATPTTWTSWTLFGAPAGGRRLVAHPGGYFLLRCADLGPSVTETLFDRSGEQVGETWLESVPGCRSGMAMFDAAFDGTEIIVAWTDSALHIARITTDGVVVPGPIDVDLPVDRVWPYVAAAAGVTWVVFSYQGQTHGVRVQDGALVGEPIPIYAGGSPTAVATSGGAYLALASPSTGGQVRAIALAADGTVGTPVEVNGLGYANLYGANDGYVAIDLAPVDPNHTGARVVPLSPAGAPGPTTTFVAREIAATSVPDGRVAIISIHDENFESAADAAPRSTIELRHVTGSTVSPPTSIVSVDYERHWFCSDD
jgi:hypothetical protein